MFPDISSGTVSGENYMCRIPFRVSALRAIRNYMKVFPSIGHVNGRWGKYLWEYAPPSAKFQCDLDDRWGKNKKKHIYGHMPQRRPSSNKTWANGGGTHLWECSPASARGTIDGGNKMFRKFPSVGPKGD